MELQSIRQRICGGDRLEFACTVSAAARQASQPARAYGELFLESVSLNTIPHGRAQWSLQKIKFRAFAETVFPITLVHCRRRALRENRSANGIELLAAAMARAAALESGA